MDHMLIPRISQNAPVNTKKIAKLAQSKQAAEAAKHCEYIVRQFDGYHTSEKDRTLIVQEALETLDKLVNHLFIGLSKDEKTTLVNMIYGKVMTKWNGMVDKLQDIQFYTVGKAGTTILNSAKRRDIHIEKVESILNEMKENGQNAPTRLQRRALRKHLKRATRQENKRIIYITARNEALAKNEEIAKAGGPDVYRAFEYLYKVPDAPAKSQIKPLVVR